MTVGFYGPHNPYVCDPDLYHYYYDTLPRLSLPGLPDDLHPAMRGMYERHKMVDPDPEAVHRSRAAYYGMVETLDRHLGRLRSAVRETLGEREDVIFVYASDHGDMAGSHGTFWKQSFYEGSVRIPMIWSGPGIPKGVTIDQPTSLLDLGCSLLGAVSGEQPLESDGRDLSAVIAGDQPADPDRIIISQLANRGAKQLPAAMIRRQQYKLIYHGVADQRPQLFNLDEDPHEQRDLGVQPTAQHQTIISELSELLLQQWNPEQADQQAKLAAKHMRRLWQFDSQHEDSSIEHWQGDVIEQ